MRPNSGAAMSCADVFKAVFTQFGWRLNVLAVATLKNDPRIGLSSRTQKNQLYLKPCES